ncbi:MAG: hypothetical protein R2881_04370 [Eubacteriales bacterium]
MKRPALIEGKLTERQYLYVTVSVNHDLRRRRARARFAQTLKEIVESGEVLKLIHRKRENTHAST